MVPRMTALANVLTFRERLDAWTVDWIANVIV
jgi:hypothetical protein